MGCKITSTRMSRLISGSPVPPPSGDRPPHWDSTAEIHKADLIKEPPGASEKKKRFWEEEQKSDSGRSYKLLLDTALRVMGLFAIFFWLKSTQRELEKQQKREEKEEEERFLQSFENRIQRIERLLRREKPAPIYRLTKLDRSKLVEQLNASLGDSAVVIEGPSGTGKSSVVQEWVHVESQKRPAFCFEMDFMPRTKSEFFDRLVASLLGDEEVRPNGETVLKAAFSRMATDSKNQRSLLIIDNAHNLWPSEQIGREIMDVFRTLFERLAVDVALIVSGDSLVDRIAACKAIHLTGSHFSGPGFSERNVFILWPHEDDETLVRYLKDYYITAFVSESNIRRFVEHFDSNFLVLVTFLAGIRQNDTEESVQKRIQCNQAMSHCFLRL